VSDGLPNEGVFQFHGGNAPSVLHTFRSSSDVEVETTGTGSHILKGVAIFRAGTFRDSRGIERTWTRDDLVAMAANFTSLKDGGVFPNVPIRENHTIDVKDVVGYFSRVYLDPSDPDTLLADIEITEPDAFGKWQRGTYRSRSLEIGPYLANGSDKPLWPTVLGLAFVDVPAVEGLHRQAPPQHFSQYIEDGNPVPPKKDVNMDSKALAHLASWIESGRTADEWIAACNFAKQQEDQQQQQAQHAAQQQQLTSYYTAVQLHQANAQALGLPVDYSTPYTFRINGAEITDPAQVQAHIDGLHTAIAEAAKQERIAYVNKLVTDGKLLATQQVATQALVDTFTAEQFTQYRQTMDAQAPLSLFQNHGAPGSQGGGGTGNEHQQQVAPEQRKAVLKETVAQFRRMEKSNEFIKGTDAYKELVALDPTAKID
jgi:hypothetical protein